MTSDEPPLSTYRELAQIITDLPLIVRSARRARGLSLRAAAKEAGMSFSSLTRLENGAGSTVSVLIAVLQWLDQTGPGSGRQVRKWEREASR